MKKFIITISREFGCNAREVARKAAAELGVEFYDKDLVDMAAERAGISRDSFLDSEEMLDKNADRLLKSFEMLQQMTKAMTKGKFRGLGGMMGGMPNMNRMHGFGRKKRLK